MSRAFKIFRPDGPSDNSIILECDGFSMEIIPTSTTVEVGISIDGRGESKFRFPRNDCVTVAALLRAAADDLEKL